MNILYLGSRVRCRSTLSFEKLVIDHVRLSNPASTAPGGVAICETELKPDDARLIAFPGEPGPDATYVGELVASCPIGVSKASPRAGAKMNGVAAIREKTFIFWRLSRLFDLCGVHRLAGIHAILRASTYVVAATLGSQRLAKFAFRHGRRQRTGCATKGRQHPQERETGEPAGRVGRSNPAAVS